MAGSGNPIDFEVLEGHKENVQALPGGRSAKKLASVLSPRGPLQQMPTPTDVRNANDAVRMQFESEIAAIDESDDPLDVYHRYVAWTLDAYPSAQATPQSGLRPLLERATKAFTSSGRYRNDPRYVKLWVHYINLFSDAPREAFVFLSRHGIGEELALYYEEYAAWLEGVGRLAQAEEVYKLGLERQAQPAARLLRKFGEFERRRASRPAAAVDEPTSPALPAVRPVLATKVDPFALGGAGGAPDNPQQQQQQQQQQQAAARAGGGSRPGKAKMAIFSDADAPQQQPAMSSRGPDARGWDNIGSVEDRKKENTVEARPWVGETLPTQGRKPVGPKMAVFRDTSRLQPIKNKRPPLPAVVIHPSEHQVTVHPQTGRKERVYVDLEVIYPMPKVAGTELSFEEVWAANRGWFGVDWDAVDEEEAAAAAAAAALREEEGEEEEESTAMDLDGDEEMGDGGGGHVGSSAYDDEDIEMGDDYAEPAPPPPVVKPAKKLMVRQDTLRLDKDVDLAPPPPQQQQQHNSRAPMQPRQEGPRPAATQMVPLRPEGGGHDDDGLVLDENGAVMEKPKAGRPKKKKTMEVNETQIIKARLDSPPKPKMKKRRSMAAEPTMTMHTKAATDDIYAIFNQPLKPGGYVEQEDDGESVYETDYETEGDYTSVADSEGTTTQHVLDDEEEDDDGKSVGSEWSDFTARRDVVEEEGEEGESDDDDDAASERTGRSMYENEDDGPDSPPRTRTVYVPVPPEDYEAPTRPYRDAAEKANSRLPFMTPIVERTEMSLNLEASRRRLGIKTPALPTVHDGRGEGDGGGGRGGSSASEDDDEDSDGALLALEQMSSPLLPGRESPSPLKLGQKAKAKGMTTVATTTSKAEPPPRKMMTGLSLASSFGRPIITDAQCNPVHDNVQAEILAKMDPPLGAYPGFFDHRDEDYGRGNEIRKHARAVAKASAAAGGGGEKAAALKPIRVAGGYLVRRELGAGAFAPVYLVENPAADAQHEEADSEEGYHGGGGGARRAPVEALKMENPPSAWEFRVMRLAHARLAAAGCTRAAASVSTAHELHLFRDEAFLVLEYHAHGTLLGVVNHFRTEPSGVMDETLAMFFAVELLRTVEALHAQGILHGDLKADNCMLRLDARDGGIASLASKYRADGAGGWAARGLSLIDFGRAICMADFVPGVQFVADWKPAPQDCAEVREGRPWSWHIDYFGLAGVVHCLLFGKYMDTARVDMGAAAGVGVRRYRIKEGLKRYWQTDIWGDVFDVLLNPGAHVGEAAGGGGKGGGGGGALPPVTPQLARLRARMERWLEANCERGVGLRALLGKVEAYAAKLGRKSS